MPLASNSFQQKCFDHNIHNQLIKSIKTIDFESDKVKNDLNLMINALNLIHDQNTDDRTIFMNALKIGRTSMTTFGTVIDIGDVFSKIVQETHDTHGSRRLDEENVTIWCLLYLNNFQCSEFDKNLESAMVSFALDDERNSQDIVSSLVTMLKKLANEVVTKEFLPSWLPITFVSTSNISICNKIMSCLTPIAEQVPHLFFKDSSFSNKTTTAPNLKDILLGSLLELLDAPVIFEDKELVRKIVTVVCKIFTNEKIDEIAKEYSNQLLENFLNLLKVENSEALIFDLLLSTEKILASYIYDAQSVTVKLLEIAENNKRLVNNFLRGNHKEVCSMLSKFPHLLDFDTKIEEEQIDTKTDESFNKTDLLSKKNQNEEKFEQFLELHRVILNSTLREKSLTWLFLILSEYPRLLDIDNKVRYCQETMTIFKEESLWLLLSECINLLTNPFQDVSINFESLNVLSFTEVLFYGLCEKYDDMKVLGSFADSHKSQFNIILRGEDNTLKRLIFEKIVYFPMLLEIDVKLLFFSQVVEMMDQSSLLNLLSECLEKYEMPRFGQKQKIPGAVVTLSVLIDNNDNQFYNVAKNHQTTINKILLNHINNPKAGSLCLIFQKYPKFLSLSVKRLYLDSGMIRISSAELESMVEETLNILPTLSNELMIFDSLSSIDIFLGKLGTTMSDSIKCKVIQCAASYKHIINKYFYSNRKTHFLELLFNTSNILDFGSKLAYALLTNKSKQFLTNFASECSPYLDEPEKISYLGDNIVAMLRSVKMNKEELGEFFENHKTIFNSVLRQKIQLELFIILVAYLSKMDNDVLVKYAITGTKIFNVDTLSRLFFCILQKLENSTSKEAVVEFLPAIEELLSCVQKAMYIGPAQTQLISFALINSKILNEVLFENKKLFEKGEILIALGYSPQLYDILSMDVKLMYIEQLKDVFSSALHCQLLEECLERNIHKPTTMLKPINDILYNLTQKGKSEGLALARKYKELLNRILDEDTCLNYHAIANFLTNFPQFMSFDNKIKYLPSVLERMEEKFLLEFVYECLNKLNDQLIAPDFLKLSLAVKSAIGYLPTESTDKFYELAERYDSELKHVVNSVGFDETPAWMILLTKLGIFFQDFKPKVEDLRKQLDLMKLNWELPLLVKRQNVLTDSYTQLNKRSAEEWKNRLKIKFVNEIGVDGGGLLREWFTILTREIFNPNYALFTIASDDNNSYTINKASHVNPEHLDYFKFVGRFIGKSIMEKQFIDCPFTKSLYKHILNIPVTFEDFQDEDPTFCNSLKNLLNNPICEFGLDLTFSTEIEEFGVVIEKELKENGKNIEVTDKNKDEYVKLLSQMRMTGSIQTQLDSLLDGFHEVMPRHMIEVFTVKELELLICGEPEIDIDDLEENTTYQQYQPSDIHIQWFWRAVRAFYKDDKARLLMFVTGASKAPPGGFKADSGKKFIISKTEDENRLPTAHTCTYQLVLPQYESYEKLNQSLLTAIRECSEGFGFS